MGGHFPYPVAPRFWKFTLKTNTCWPWLGSTDKDGYGFLKVCGVQMKAHRVAWELFVGPIPVGEIVLHKCDQPGCVRPTHLFLGTFAENSADMVAKRRSAKGERVGNSKLTVAKVLEIRRRAAAGEKHEVLGHEFGVRANNIYWIVTRHTWKHV